MKRNKNGLNDSDKILITVALWICAVALFVATLTLPMLPEKVTIFVTPETDSQYYSKYYNLVLILTAIVPAAIVLVSAFIKERNRLQNNFLSISLFSIMLALCMNSVIIYGILQQFDASKAVKLLNFNSLAVIIVSFVFSLTFALLPTLLRNKVAEITENANVTKKAKLIVNLFRYWNVGAYVFLLCAIVGSFLPNAYCYIPLTVAVIGVAAFMIFVKPKKTKPPEQADHRSEAEKSE